MFECTLIPAIMTTSPIGDLAGASGRHDHEPADRPCRLHVQPTMDHPCCEALSSRCLRLEALLEAAWWRIHQLQQEALLAEQALDACAAETCREHDQQTGDASRPILVQQVEHPRECVVHETVLVIESMLDILA